MRQLSRLCLLMVGFALTSYGLLWWHDESFTLSGVWPFAGDFELHPLHLLVLGIAMIPPTVWEIFLLDTKSRSAQQHVDD